MRILSYILLLLTMLVGITFAALNATPVIFHYYFGSGPIPLAMLLLGIFIFGIAAGIVFMIFPMLRTKRDNYRLKTHIKIVEKELENLRSLPLNNEE